MADVKAESSFPEEAPGHIEKERMTDLEASSSFSNVAPVQRPRTRFMDLTEEEKAQAVDNLCSWADKNLPPEYPLFELFSVRVEFEGERSGELHGIIEAIDGSGAVVLFNREPNESQPITNNGLVSLSGPDPRRSISASGSIELIVELYVKLNQDKELQVSYSEVSWDFLTDCLERYNHGRCQSIRSTGEQGSVVLYYISLKRAVQATLEATFRTPDGRAIDACGSIIAYYGNFNYDCKPEQREFYRAKLFDRPKGKCAVLETGEMPLTRSVLAVPSRCSLVIEAHLFDFQGNEILGGICTFPAKIENTSDGFIQGQACCVNLQVVWKCKESA